MINNSFNFRIDEKVTFTDEFTSNIVTGKIWLKVTENVNKLSDYFYEMIDKDNKYYKFSYVNKVWKQLI